MMIGQSRSNNFVVTICTYMYYSTRIDNTAVSNLKTKISASIIKTNYQIEGNLSDEQAGNVNKPSPEF